MKRALAFALLALAALGLGAQSRFLVIGTSANGKISTDLAVQAGDTWSNTALDAWVGYSVAPGLEIGPQVGLTSSRQETSAGTIYDKTTLYLGMQAGFFMFSGSSIIPFLRAAALYRTYSLETNGSLTSEDSYYCGRLTGGVDLLFAGNVALSLGATLQYYKSIKWNYYNVNVSGFLGFDIFLPL